MEQQGIHNVQKESEMQFSEYRVRKIELNDRHIFRWGKRFDSLLFDQSAHRSMNREVVSNSLLVQSSVVHTESKLPAFLGSKRKQSSPKWSTGSNNALRQRFLSSIPDFFFFKGRSTAPRSRNRARVGNQINEITTSIGRKLSRQFETQREIP